MSPTAGRDRTRRTPGSSALGRARGLRAGAPGSRRRPCRAASAASCAAWWTAGRRRRCRAVWSVSCWRQRASRPSPLEGDRLAVQAGAGHRGVVGAGALDERAGQGQAALVVLVEAAGRRPSGSVEHRVADDADGVLARRVGAVEDEDRHGRRRSGRPPARRRPRRTSSRPCRRPAPRSSSSYDVTGCCARCMTGVAPAGHRADGAALRERAVRCVDGSLGTWPGDPRRAAVTRRHGEGAWRMTVTRSYIEGMSLTNSLKPGGEARPVVQGVARPDRVRRGRPQPASPRAT